MASYTSVQQPGESRSRDELSERVKEHLKSGDLNVDLEWETRTLRWKMNYLFADTRRQIKIGKACSFMTCVVLFFIPFTTTLVAASKGLVNAQAAAITPWGTKVRKTDHVGSSNGGGGTPVYADEELSNHRRLFMGRRLAEGEEYKDWLVGLRQNITQEELQKLKDRLGEEAGASIETEGHLAGGVPEIVINSTLSQIEEIIDGVEGIAYVEQDCEGEMVPDQSGSSGYANYIDAEQGAGTTARRLASDEIADHYHKHISDLYEAKDRRLLGVGRDGQGRRLPACEGGQAFPDWGLDRTDSKQNTDKSYGCHPSSLTYGEGVNVYVVDTGIRYTHVDFEGRAKPALTWQNGKMEKCDPTDFECAKDDDGHGTHCAALVAGKRYGVAKKANIWGIRTFTNSNKMSVSWILQAIDFVVTHGQKPSVMSMSIQMLGTWKPALDAITEATEHGVAIVVAAGNAGNTEHPDACDHTPAYVPSAIVVGSIDKSDFRSSYSNFGSCLDIFAPGRDIKSASHKSDDGSITHSGTSQATPMVAGALALLLAHNPNLTVKGVSTLLLEGASKGQVEFGSKVGEDQSPNKLLYVGPGFENLADGTDLFELYGENYACRGRNEADGDPWSQLFAGYWGTSYYANLQTNSIEECQEHCKKAASCTGVQFKREASSMLDGIANGGFGECNIWTRGIANRHAKEGTDCYRFKR